MMTERKKEENLIKTDVILLISKITIFALLLAVLFLFVFGICRCSDNTMSPAFKDGDLVFYYRIHKELKPSEVVVLEKGREIQIRRVVAKYGDEVDITKDGLKINGYLQQENEIYTETLPYTTGITFPVTLGKGEYFVLGDDREGAKDSRVYGVVKESEIKGTVVTLLRRRGL